METTYANIMLLGRTGVGKSSFINYLIGEEVCITGKGKPITQGFEVYEYPNVDGLPLRIFDSKGLEVEDYANIKDSIIQFLKERCNSDNIYKWIHSIFYCINIKDHRFEPAEKEFINNIQGKISQTVHIIITHCENTESGRKESDEMVNYIKSELKNEAICIYCVNSTLTENRNGTYEPFGRETVLNQIFKMLWSDMSYKVASEYAEELHNSISSMVKDMQRDTKKAGKNISVFDLLRGDEYLDNKLDNLSDNLLEQFGDEIEDVEEDLMEKYQEKTNLLVEFCNKYGQSVGIEIELEDPFDYISDDFINIDIDEIVHNTKVGRMLDEWDNIDEDNIWDMLKMTGQAVMSLFSLQKIYEEVCDSIFEEIIRSIPNTKKLRKKIYKALMKGYPNV